jgi:hypothetical protein
MEEKYGKQKQHISITVNAPKEKVWNVMHGEKPIPVD